MDTDAITTLLQDVAAEVITPRFQSLDEGEVHEKSPGDLVTVADHEAEVLITEALQAAYPGTVVLGEEATAADPTLLDRFAAAPHGFTVDPVDGTKNFVHGSPDHAVMAAELRDGVVVRSWIWQPQHQRAYVAELGAGAWCNRTRLAVGPVSDAPRGRTSRRAWVGRRLGDQPELTLTWASWASELLLELPIPPVSLLKCSNKIALLWTNRSIVVSVAVFNSINIAAVDVAVVVKQR